MAPWLIEVQNENRAEVRGTPEAVDRALLVEQAKTSAEPWSWLSVVAYLDAVNGNTGAARQALGELVADGGAKLPTGLNWHVLAYVAETATLLRDREAAELLYAKLEPNARLFPVVARGGACIGSVQYFIAGLAQTLGRSDEAELRLRRAITENLRIGARPRATIALARLGELLAERGEPHAPARRCARPPRRRTSSTCRAGRSVPAPPLGADWPWRPDQPQRKPGESGGTSSGLDGRAASSSGALNSDGATSLSASG